MAISLSAGNWSGRGTLFAAEASLGEQLECDISVEADEESFILTGALVRKPAHASDLSIMVAPNDNGLWAIDARLGDVTVSGLAKLESEPNVGLLWGEGGLHFAFVLFPHPAGQGFRGFLHEAERTLTWEMLLTAGRRGFHSDNVVRLPRRR